MILDLVTMVHNLTCFMTGSLLTICSIAVLYTVYVIFVVISAFTVGLIFLSCFDGALMIYTASKHLFHTIFSPSYVPRYMSYTQK